MPDLPETGVMQELLSVFRYVTGCCQVLRGELLTGACCEVDHCRGFGVRLVGDGVFGVR